jgi:ribonuclease BN (tRNA processing enzyme)
MKANTTFTDVKSDDVIKLPEGVTVSTIEMNHPSHSIGFRVEIGDDVTTKRKSFCYMTDVELSAVTDYNKLIEFAYGTDLLVLDSFYDKGKVVAEFGHSDWKECTDFAKKADVKRLALFHFNFNCTDDDLDIIDGKAKQEFSGAFASKENTVIFL